MRKQTKWAAILGAAAVMTFGACMTSFAATGWVEEGGEWYYYNKDEEAVTEQWQKASDGKYYWLNEDGVMAVSSWVEGSDGNKYFVNSHGVRITNEWRYMFASEDDDAEEESWFYFDSNGKMLKGKKNVNGKTYYFSEEGKMLTGWVDYVSGGTAQKNDTGLNKTTVYCLDSGERAIGWMKLYAPEDFEDQEEDEEWYNFKSTGIARINAKATINGKSYVFDDEGKMLSGWVNVTPSTSSDYEYEYVKVTKDTQDANLIPTEQLLYCGSTDDGAVKKAGWINSVAPGKDEEDADLDKYWYYAQKDGTLFCATSNDYTASKAKLKGDDIRLSDENTDLHQSFVIKKIGTKYYGFYGSGRMADGLVIIEQNGPDYNAGVYYFGKSSDGAMKTGSVSVTNDDDDSYGFYFATKTNDKFTKGQGVSGNQGGKLYSNGISVGAKEGSTYQVALVWVPVDGDSYFIINENGRIMTSIKTVYKADNGMKFRNQDKVDGKYIVQFQPKNVTGDDNWTTVDASHFGN